VGEKLLIRMCKYYARKAHKFLMFHHIGRA